MFDWTECSLEETFSLFANARWAIGTRLHFLLLADYFNVEYEPFIYQEKIVKVLELEGK